MDSSLYNSNYRDDYNHLAPHSNRNNYLYHSENTKAEEQEGLKDSGAPRRGRPDGKKQPIRPPWNRRLKAPIKKEYPRRLPWKGSRRGYMYAGLTPLAWRAACGPRTGDQFETACGPEAPGQSSLKPQRAAAPTTGPGLPYKKEEASAGARLRWPPGPAAFIEREGSACQEHGSTYGDGGTASGQRDRTHLPRKQNREVPEQQRNQNTWRSGE